jgi:hypothetical protein
LADEPVRTVALAARGRGELWQTADQTGGRLTVSEQHGMAAEMGRVKAMFSLGLLFFF